MVEWQEFMVYIKWAYVEYSDEITTVDDILRIAFVKGVIPCMQDEIIRTNYPDFSEL